MRHMNILRVALIVGLILLIPLFGNIFIEGWDWSLFDFVVMGALLFVTGIAIDAAARKIEDPGGRAFTIIMIVGALIAIWTELAVGALTQLMSALFS
jgi:hypothetical protein